MILNERVIYISLFIFGMIFIAYLCPIGDSLISLIVAFFEMVKGKIALKTTEYNAQIKKIANECGGSSIHAIGFATPDYEEEEDYDE